MSCQCQENRHFFGFSTESLFIKKRWWNKNQLWGGRWRSSTFNMKFFGRGGIRGDFFTSHPGSIQQFCVPSCWQSQEAQTSTMLFKTAHLASWYISRLVCIQRLAAEGNQFLPSSPKAFPARVTWWPLSWGEPFYVMLRYHGQPMARCTKFHFFSTKNLFLQMVYSHRLSMCRSLTTLNEATIPSRSKGLARIRDTR